MISSKMNRTNGGNRSSRIFVGILLVTIACLVVLYYHEHRSAKDAETLSVTLDEQTRTLDESVERFTVLKNACREEREQLTKTNVEQEAKIETALHQAQDWQQRYERVINDKNTMESELARLKSELQSLQQNFKDKENEVLSVKDQLTNNARQCDNDKQLAANEAAKLEQTKCAGDKQRLGLVQQQLVQEKQELQEKLNQCENSMKGFSDQLRRDAEQQGISNDKKVPIPLVQDYKSQMSMDDKFKERLKEKLLQPRDEHQSVVSRTTSNHLPLDNLSSKDVDMSNFFNKEEPSKDSSNHDPSNDVAKYFKHSDQPSFPPLPFGNKESPSPESPSPSDSAAHMIHVGISHDNNSNAAMDTEQKNDIKTNEEEHHDDVTTDNVTSDDDQGHIGEADVDKDDDDHDDNDDDHDDNDDHDDSIDSFIGHIDDDHNNVDQDNDQGKSFDKLLLDEDDANDIDDDDDDGNHDNGAETDQDLLKMPQLPDLSL